jgi:hypothetical protein
MRSKFKANVVILIGFLLSSYAFMAWFDKDFIYGSKHSADGVAGNSYLIVLLIGVVVLSYGVFERVLSGSVDTDTKNKDQE